MTRRYDVDGDEFTYGGETFYAYGYVLANHELTEFFVDINYVEDADGERFDMPEVTSRAEYTAIQNCTAQFEDKLHKGDQYEEGA
jgi:hypothetical protein